MGVPSKNLAYIAVNVQMESIGTAFTRYVAAPAAGVVREIFVAVETAVDADNVLTPQIAGTAITGGAITLTTAHTAGRVVSAQPTAANSVLKGQALGVATDGGGNTGQVNVTFLIEQTP